MFLKLHTYLHESPFGSHETSESGHQNCIVLKPVVRTNQDEKYAVSKVSGFVWTGLQMHHSVTFGKFYHVSCMPR